MHDDFLRLGDDFRQMRFVPETFRIQLVDIFRTRGTGGEPSAAGDNLQSADGSVVTGGAGQFGGNRVASQGVGGDGFGESRVSAAFCSGVAGASIRV